MGNRNVACRSWDGSHPKPTRSRDDVVVESNVDDSRDTVRQQIRLVTEHEGLFDDQHPSDAASLNNRRAREVSEAGIFRRSVSMIPATRTNVRPD